MSTPYYNCNTNHGTQPQPVVVQGYAVDTSKTNGTVAAYEPPGRVPLHLEPYSQLPERQERETDAKFRDVAWALLFYLHLGVVAYLTAVNVPTMANIMGAGYAADGNNNQAQEEDDRRHLQDNDNNNQGWNNYNYNNNNNYDNISVNLPATLSMVALLGLSGLILSTLALGFLIVAAETLIKVGMVASIIMCLLGGLLSLVAGQLMGAVVGLGMTAMLAWYACGVWPRIPFAACNLVTAATAVRENLGLAFYAYVSFFLTFGWAVWWAATAISTLFVLGDCHADGTCDQPTNGLVVFLLFVSYYWAVQVIGNVVHVTTAGVTGTWWMQPPSSTASSSSCCSPTVRDSLLRAMTYSFGSICLGSLIVAIISAMREFVHMLRENGDSMLACCAECLLACIESMAEYFNKWAFVFVGIYGFSFVEAGQNVIGLFKSRGWTTIITDDLCDRALLLTSFLVGLVNGLVGLLLGILIGMGEGVPVALAALIGFITGLSLCSTLLSVVSSACNSVIVLYAEAPAEFQANHPHLSDKMRATWRQAWPVEFRY